MKVGPETSADLADYVGKPAELDPDKVLAHLPGWTLKGGRAGVPGFKRWLFQEPHYGLQVCIEHRGQINDNRVAIQQMIKKEDPGRAVIMAPVTSFEMEDLNLVDVQTRGNEFSLGFFNPRGSYYLVGRSQYLSYLYEVEVYEGRNREMVPSWLDQLLARFKLHRHRRTHRIAKTEIRRLTGD